jgi:hypothetical protein
MGQTRDYVRQRCEDGANHHRFDNRAEHLVVVDNGLLGKTADHPARLVPS